MIINPQDRGLLLGDGVFETIMVLNHVALWRLQHVARMQAAANELGIGFDRTMVNAAIDQHLRAGPHALRLTLTRGAAPRGLASDGGDPTLLAHADPFDVGLMFRPVSLVTSRIRRNETAPSSRLKTLSYIDNIAAAREAAPHEALMLNTSGHVASAHIANIFMLKDGALITPSLDQAILPGIMRQVLLDAFPHQERALAPAELFTADAVFLTNSLRFIRPVTMLDGKPLGTASLAPQINHLRALAGQQCKIDLPGPNA